MAAGCTWLASGLILLVLTNRPADANSKLDATAVNALSLQQTLAKLGVGPSADEKERRLLSIQAIDVVAAKVLQSVPTSKCYQNTFFLDWGSSGMKVHAVHSSKAHGNQHADVKIVGLGPKVSEPQLLAIFGNLSAKLVDGHVGGAAIATAGFRLLPSEASATWERVRTWNEKNHLLQNCSLAQTAGCQTLPGSLEADFEMQGMMEYLHGEHKHLGERFGMASCGGASIQLAFWGSPEKELADCVRDLDGFSTKSSTKYDKARIRLGVKRQAAWFSWLANHRVPLSIRGRSDYSVGGVDEMRERYDSWLELEQGSAATNPCVASEADALFSIGGKCELLAGKKRSCLKDRFGSYITRLKGRPDSTREICRESIAVFLQEDEMLSTWHTSSSCRKLAMKTPEWNFLTAFSRPTQLGADLKKSTTWAEVKECIKKFGKTPMFESKQDLKDRMPGEYLTSALLIGFLDRLGLNDNATIQPSKGDVAATAMRHFGLSPGWISEDQDECLSKPIASRSRSSPPRGVCKLPPTLQVAGGRWAEDYFKSNTTITVACSPGFTGSRPTWSLTCSQGIWKDATQAKLGTVIGVVQDSKSPENQAVTANELCRRPHCAKPIVDFGAWFVHEDEGKNQTFRLLCNSGYEPANGPAHLTCMEDGTFTSFARCIPAGDAGAWRTRNIVWPGFVDFVLLAALATALYMFYSRSKQGSVGTQQESQPIMPAEHEME